MNWVLRFEFVQDLMDIQQALILVGRSEFQCADIDPNMVTPVALRALASRALDEDSAHCFGCRVKELGAILKL